VSSRKNSLGLLALRPQTSHGSSILSDVVTSLLLEQTEAVFDEDVVKVFSTQVSVAISCLDFKDAVFDCKERHVKGTTTKVEDQYVSFTLVLLVETVCNGSSCWLVDDSLHVEACDGSSIFSCLSLRVVEVGWDGDDSILNRFSEVSLSDLLLLQKNHGGNLFSLELLLFAHVLDGDHWLVSWSCYDLEGPQLDVLLDSLVGELSSDESLGIEDGVNWVSGCLILSCISDQSLSLSEGDV